ncbi:MAG: polymer-forming cytoskeletal protein, partial [Verrucomicrobiae bacterium]|nr:polymer-forming cytoskeletal protein [Verrucomicrobiae bacterium]
MFDRFRKRKEVVLSCPFCGAEQSEPSLVISSFCRKCGRHFRIENGKAIAPPGVVASGISMVVRDLEADDAFDDDDEPLPEPAPPSAPASKNDSWLDQARRKNTAALRDSLMPAAEPGKNAAAPDEPTETDEEEIDEEPVAEADVEEDEEDRADDPDPAQLGSAAEPVERLGQGSIGALLGAGAPHAEENGDDGPDTLFSGRETDADAEDESTALTSADAIRIPKMPPGFVPPDQRKKGSEPEKRGVRCFACNHKQLVSVSAKSTQCGRCSVYISLIDHDITTPWSQNIRTRGDVTIHRKGSVTGCDIACHDLVVAGNISASVDCSGNATFRTSGKVMGNMHCKTLIVEKKCEMNFPQGVVAENAEVYGTLVGNIICSGAIRIYKSGSVIGDATAKAVVLKDGGILTGRMSIRPDID